MGSSSIVVFLSRVHEALRLFLRSPAPCQKNQVYSLGRDDYAVLCVFGMGHSSGNTQMVILHGSGVAERSRTEGKIDLGVLIMCWKFKLLSRAELT